MIILLYNLIALFYKRGPTRDRPDIRLNPVPAGYPASISGSGTANLTGYLARYSFLKCIS